MASGISCTFCFPPITVWRLAYVEPVPKRYASSDVGDYRPMSITPVLSKVFEKIVAGKLSHFYSETVCFLLLSFRFVGA